MTRFFEQIYDFLSQRRRTALWTVFAVVALCAVSAYRMNYDEDISAFMPMDAQTEKYAEVFNNMGGQSKIVVAFKGGDDLAAIEASMRQFGESMAKRDKEHLARNLQVQVDEAAMLGVMQNLWQDYPSLLTDADYQHLDSVLQSADGIKKAMEQSKMMLMLPTGGIAAQSIPYDPLHLSGGVTARLRSLNVGDAYQTIDGYLFKDGVGLVMLESPFGISESHNNQRLQRLIDDCIADVKAQNKNIEVSAVGAPLIAVTNASQIKTDSLLAVALAVVLILLVLVYAFRRIGKLVWVFVSVFVGWLFALGVISLLRDGISIIVIGIGSVIIGIAVNYPLHFINHLRHETDMREALKEMVPPLLVGNITTVAAFLCLVFLDSRAMQDLGLFGSLTLVGTILFVLVCLPLVLKPSRKPQGKELPFGKLQIDGRGRMRKVMPWIVAGLTIVFGYFSLDTSFDANMQDINYMLPEQRATMKFLADGTGGQTVYAVAEGRSLEEALRRNEALTAKLATVKGIEKQSGIAGVMPSDSMAEERMRRWHSYWASHKADIDRLAAEAGAAGFSAEAFAPFVAMAGGDDVPEVRSAVGSPIYSLIGHNFVMHTDGGYKVVNFLQVDPKNMERVKAAVGSVAPAGCFAFTAADVSSHLAEVLSDSFNYIGFACGFVVFAFLWLSFGSIELSLLSFLPLAVSWLWILGLMNIFGMQFNIVNIILATFIFGQGDDYTIFITEGLMYEYTTGKRRLEQYKNSVALSAIIMFIGIGTLIFSKHPAMRSLAEVAIVGMVTVVAMAYYLPPLIFRWMTHKHGRLREYPVTLPRLAASAYAITFFLCGMFFLLLPYTALVHRPLSRVWKGSEAFYHRLLQRVSHYVVRHVPGVKFTQVNSVGETFERPAVIVCNHQSHLDLMAVMQLSPRVIVLTNDWVWRNPYYGAVIHTAEFYPVSNGFDNNFPNLKRLVERGYSIVVFPEGTRTSDGNIHRFHKGAFTLAKALGVDVLPLYLHGLYDVLPKHDFMLRRGSVTLEVGSRVPASEIAAEADDRAIARAMHRRYVEKYAEMRSLLETDAYRAPYEEYKKKYKVKL